MLQLKPWSHYPLRIVQLSARHNSFLAECPTPPQHVDTIEGQLHDVHIRQLWKLDAADCEESGAAETAEEAMEVDGDELEQSDNEQADESWGESDSDCPSRQYAASASEDDDFDEGVIDLCGPAAAPPPHLSVPLVCSPGSRCSGFVHRHVPPPFATCAHHPTCDVTPHARRELAILLGAQWQARPPRLC